MDMLKRMQKANISSSEIPLFGLDIGGVTIKLAYLDVENRKNSSEVLEDAKYLDPEQVENRNILKKYLKDNLHDYLIKGHANTQMKIKNVFGHVRLYLFTRDVFADKFLKDLIGLNLKKPFICATGAALVNYMNTLTNDIKARVLMLSSENEGIVRGLNLLQSQTASSFHQIQFDVENKAEVVYKIDLLNENFYPSTVAIIGTSTTYLRLNSPYNYTFLNNSAISGQTFVGLCNVANKFKSDSNNVMNFDDCLKAANHGENESLDVTIKKLCGGSESKVEQFLYLHNLETGLYVRKDDFIHKFGDLSISCFGDGNSVDEKNIKLNDFAASSLNLVCYQMAEMLCLYAKLRPNNKHVICSGSFLINNMKAKYLITKYVRNLMHGQMKSNFKDIYFVDNEAHLGALGCLAVDAQNCQVESRD